MPSGRLAAWVMTGLRLRQTGYYIVSSARSRAGEYAFDEGVLGEGDMWSKVTRSPLASTKIMVLDVGGTDAELDFVLMVEI